MSLKYRRDGRTLEEYTEQMLKGTRRENLWAEILKVNLEEKGYKVEVVDNGVDGTGAVVKKSSKDLSKVDKIYTINGKSFPIEIKTCDQGADFDKLKYITIKVTSLRAAIEQQAIMVICENDSTISLYGEVARRFYSNNLSSFC